MDEQEVKCQGAPSSLDPQLVKEVVPSVFRPIFNLSYQRIPSCHQESTMGLGTFDPSKYGAPPSKHKVVNEQSKPQNQVVKVVSCEDSSSAVNSMPDKGLQSGTMTQSTLSEISNVAMSLHTQSNEPPTAFPRAELNFLKPKSTNRISIPGFDASKYGKPGSRPSQTHVKNETKVNTRSAEDKVIIEQYLSHDAYTPPTSLPHKVRSPSVVQEHRVKKQPAEDIRIFASTTDPTFIEDNLAITSGGRECNPLLAPIEKDDKLNQLPSSTASTTETVLRVPETSTTASQLLPRVHMIPSSLPPPSSGVSKEERLKQVKETSLRQIAIRNRKRGAAQETTSLRDLQLARTPTGSESHVFSSVPTQPLSTDIQASVTPSTIATQSMLINNDSGAPRKPQLLLPLPLPGMSKKERLKQLQEASLRQIGMRNRTKGGDPETTSLMDLQLARTPALSEFHGSNTVSSTIEYGQAPVKARHLVDGESTLHPSRGIEYRDPVPYHQPQSSGQAEVATGGTVHTPGTSKPNTAINHSKTTETPDNVALPATSNVTEKKTRNPRWCSPEELRPEPNLETNSNAWGSDMPSNSSVASNESTRPMQFHGKLFYGPPAGDRDELDALVGWDGKLQPPPVDWNDRPRFNNNSPAFKNSFNNWFATAAAETFEFVDMTPMFKKIPKHIVENLDFHPDGLSMIRKEDTLNALNISKYGYNIEPTDVAKYAEPVNAEDFTDWGKLDMREPDNVKFKEETAKQLVDNWMAHQQNSKRNITSLAMMHGSKPLKESKAPKPEINLNKPSVNIYLRPAVRTDIKQLTDLYNWWVENSVRPAETRAIELSDMRERFDNSRDDEKLPFIVAILKGKKDVPRDNYTGIKGEQIVGFAVATGFTAMDYVEHIAAELEIYVHHRFRRLGVGRCLIDRLLCATDRGHMERGGYPFHCDPAERHWYEVGGARSLHKLAFIARHHSRPKKDALEELDATTWLKKWLVKEWDFEEEARLKQIGAKNGRFLDITYFSKFSKWLPEDGRVPDPEPKDHKHQAHV